MKSLMILLALVAPTLAAGCGGGVEPADAGTPAEKPAGPDTVADMLQADGEKPKAESATTVAEKLQAPKEESPAEQFKRKYPLPDLNATRPKESPLERIDREIPIPNLNATLSEDTASADLLPYKSHRMLKYTVMWILWEKTEHTEGGWRATYLLVDWPTRDHYRAFLIPMDAAKWWSMYKEGDVVAPPQNWEYWDRSLVTGMERFAPRSDDIRVGKLGGRSAYARYFLVKY